MNKVFVGKNDGVAEVVEKILDEQEPEIILVIPKNTLLEESISNFHLIKREATGAGKSILIESVDEGVLALAKASHIEAIHPLFKKRKKGSSLSDIVPMDSVEEPEENIESEPEPTIKKSKTSRQIEERYEAADDETPRRWFLRPTSLIIGGVIIVAIIGYFWIASALTKAEISINFKETPWQYQGQVVGKSQIGKVNPTDGTLPAEVFTQTKNSADMFPASGRDNVRDKATGKILIYNAFSSVKQPLVVNTRFLTPDNKLFRLAKSVTVPGAQIKDGKIIPSSIEADVVADQPGVEYNLGPIERLTIPGFKGSAKYDAFYGSLIKASGGFIGEKAVPTDKDISDAKQKTSDLLTAALKSEFLGSPSLKDFKIFDDSYQIKVNKLTVNKVTDESGRFQVIGEAILQGVAFRDNDLRSYLKSLAAKDFPNTDFKDIKITYDQVKIDFTKGEVRFAVQVDSNLAPEFSVSDFKSQVTGHQIEDVRSLVLSLQGLDEAKVSLWPIWIKKLPKNPDKITINVD